MYRCLDLPMRWPNRYSLLLIRLNSSFSLKLSKQAEEREKERRGHSNNSCCSPPSTSLPIPKRVAMPLSPPEPTYSGTPTTADPTTLAFFESTSPFDYTSLHNLAALEREVWQSVSDREAEEQAEEKDQAVVEKPHQTAFISSFSSFSAAASCGSESTEGAEEKQQQHARKVIIEQKRPLLPREKKEFQIGWYFLPQGCVGGLARKNGKKKVRGRVGRSVEGMGSGAGEVCLGVRVLSAGREGGSR